VQNLVIVESPTKAKTITKFLGNGYLVRSSFGHVRDLPKSRLGVDTKNNFEPKYVIPAKAKKNLDELKEETKKSDNVILATDEDREGEAIAWHLKTALGLDGPRTSKKVERIVFHEITKQAIMAALENPRDIDMNLVDAQQARRILDRLVGYELSPFLWKKVRSGLSAGRVQSVTVRLIVEREREIESFIKQEYWTLDALLDKNGRQFAAHLNKVSDKTLDKLDLKNETEVKKIINDLDGAEYKVTSIDKKEAHKNPFPPFTTSTLQQAASHKLGFSAKQTMLHAQRLYETGHITYMRTDSVNLAASALAQAQQVITEKFGKNYAQTHQYKTKSKGAQEAHEAIRPTNLAATPEDMGKLEAGQRKLYELIWRRTLASQMSPAVYDQTAVDIEAAPNHSSLATGHYVFRANGQVIKFDGFLKVYGKASEDVELPQLSEGDMLNLIELKPEQHFTQPPARYSDATLIKALEINGIGRPSTYAPTLSTIQDRGYVEKLEGRYKPTEIGFLVNDMLVEHFPQIVDIKFTSHVEEQLDDIADGKLKWVPVIEEFYTPFKKLLEEKKVSVEQLTEESEIPCPTCSKKMLIKFGRNGKFLMCPDKECGTTKPLPEEEAKIKELEEKTKDEHCPICGKKMDVKKGRFGYFLGCSDYPNCKGIARIENKTGFKCPKCKVGDIVERKSRGRGGRVFYACNKYPNCEFAVSKKPESEAELEEALKNPPQPKRKKTSGKKLPVIS